MDTSTPVDPVALAEAFSDAAWAKLERKPPDGGWVHGVPGRTFLIALDPSTPVLGTAYKEDLAGPTFANFVLPAWYVPGSIGPWDKAGVLGGPQSCTPGGYYVANDEGVVHDVWAGPVGHAAYDAHADDETHPTAMRVSQIVAQAMGVDWQDYHKERFAPPPAPPEPEESQHPEEEDDAAP